jgi:hypothetical protein
MDPPNTAFGGKMAKMENASRVYGNSESQERIYNPSTTSPQLRVLQGSPKGYEARDDSGPRNEGAIVTRVEILGAKSDSSRRNWPGAKVNL